MPTRLNNPDRAAFVIVMQRLHAQDLSGHVLKSGVPYEHLCIPSEFSSRRRFVTYKTDPETRERTELWTDPRLNDGELLFPSLFPQHVLDEQKKKLGHGYAGQHDQLPSPEGGGMFKLAHWRFWKPDGTSSSEKTPRPFGCYDGDARPLPVKMDRVLISLDASFKETKSGSKNAIHVIGTHGADRYLLERQTFRADFQELVKRFRATCARWPKASTKLIEEKANGAAVISTLQREIAGLVPILPEGGKESRAAACQPLIESGNMFLPDGAPWVPEFVEIFGAFPNGDEDDDVDALSQALNWLAGSPDVARALALVSN